MTPPPTNIDGTDITGATIDGQEVQEITVDGDIVFTAAPPDSLVSHWTWDTSDISGNTLTDIVGNNDCTINGVTTGAPGANQTYTTNEAGDGDGNDDIGELGNLTETDNISLALWANPDTKSSFTRLIENGVSDNVWSLTFDGSADQLIEAGVIVGGPKTTITGNPVPTGTWTHYCMTYDGSKLELYENGSSVAATTAVSGAIDSTSGNAAMFARADGALHFDGRLDDVRWYDKGLTSTEVSNLYNNGAI